MKLLLDTNALSELIRRRPSPELVARLRSADAADLFTSAVCVMELRYGAARHDQAERLWSRIESELLTRVDVLPIDTEIARIAGDLLARLERRGQPIGTEDVLIAATAIVSATAVLTRNVRHFARIPGLVVETW